MREMADESVVVLTHMCRRLPEQDRLLDTTTESLLCLRVGALRKSRKGSWEDFGLINLLHCLECVENVQCISVRKTTAGVTVKTCLRTMDNDNGYDEVRRCGRCE